MKSIRLYSYVVSSDRGFSPNPFWGVCTLACCKPVIRRKIGKYIQADPNSEYWVIGLTPKSRGNKIIYIMKVDKAITFNEYYNNPEYQMKKADIDIIRETIYKNGDNIYEPQPTGEYEQLPNQWHNEEDKKHDLSGQCVLISNNFWYFGSQPFDLPTDLSELIVGRGHKRYFGQQTIDNFISFVQYLKDTFKVGLHAKPSQWVVNDNSWEQFKV